MGAMDVPAVPDPAGPDATVPDRTRLRLAHACLEHLAAPRVPVDGHRSPAARDRGLRVLHLKGEALHPTLSAGRPPSTDCDVLVTPDDVPAYTARLTAAGWERRTTFAHGSVFTHAATYFHPVWGTVDVHRSFPGLERDPRATFAELWEHRGTVELGGHECAVPDLTAQRLVLLVHAARDAMGRREHDVDVAWTQVPPAERDVVDTLADRLGATVPLALATDRPERARGVSGEHLWREVHAGENPTVVWRARLRDARGPVHRARLLVEAARVNRDHLELALGHAPSRRELRAEWWHRLARGARRLRARRPGQG